MSQTDVVGIVPSLDLLPLAQPGLHYARHVLFTDQPGGAPLPAVGRGRAVAARHGYRAQVGRASLLAGAQPYLLRALAVGDLRAAVVLLVYGDAPAVRDAAQSLTSHHEVHVVDVGSAALRVVVSDAAQVAVQAYGPGGWQPVPTLMRPVSAHQGAAAVPGVGAAAPEAAAHPGAPLAPVAPDVSAQLPAPPDEILVPPELMADNLASDSDTSEEQAEQDED